MICYGLIFWYEKRNRQADFDLMKSGLACGQKFEYSGKKKIKLCNFQQVLSFSEFSRVRGTHEAG